MRLPLRGWAFLMEALGRFRRNRKQRRAAAAKRRSLRRRHELTTLEPRVVMNADAVDDEIIVGSESGALVVDTTEFGPNLENDTGDNGPIGVRADANPNQAITLNPGESYSWNYAIADASGGYDVAKVKLVHEGAFTSGTPRAYVESSIVREQDGVAIVNIRLTHASANPVGVQWQLDNGTALAGEDWNGVWRQEETIEDWIPEQEGNVWVADAWVPRSEFYDGANYTEGDVIDLVDANGNSNPFTVPQDWPGEELETHDFVAGHEEWGIIPAHLGDVVVPVHYSHNDWLWFAPGEIEKQLQFELIDDGRRNPMSRFGST